MRSRSLSCCFRSRFADQRAFKREGALPSRFLFARKRNHYNSQVHFLYDELLVSMGATKRKEQP